jgi:hypothetical protein
MRKPIGAVCEPECDSVPLPQTRTDHQRLSLLMEYSPDA